MALMSVMGINAQEICTFNANNALGLDSEYGTALTEGTVIGETTSFVAYIGADDTYKPQSATFSINGQEITGGLQGGTNPRDADGGMSATTLKHPVSGAFLRFEAQADGFLYVMIYAGSYKTYTVFEEETAISYTFAAIGVASTFLGSVYQFTLPYVVENGKMVVKDPIEKAEQEFLKATNPSAYVANWKEETYEDGTINKTWDPTAKVYGHGVIKFPVHKGCKYIVGGSGSKILASGFAFNTKDNVTISANGIKIIGEGDSPAIAERCAKPEISYADGKLSFSCETKDVQFVSEVTVSDAKKYYESTVSLNQVYMVSVYATKAGYVNSERTTRELIITSDGKGIIVGDVDGNGVVNVADHVRLSEIILNQ